MGRRISHGIRPKVLPRSAVTIRELFEGPFRQHLELKPILHTIHTRDAACAARSTSSALRSGTHPSSSAVAGFKTGMCDDALEERHWPST